MKKLLTIIFLLYVGILSAQTLDLRDDLLTGAVGGGEWTLVSAPAGHGVSWTQTDDNPRINFTSEPKGLYEFKYEICSESCPTCCQDVITCYYTIDKGNIGTLEGSAIEICNTDNVLLVNLIPDFEQSVDVVYIFSGDLIGDETLVVAGSLLPATYNVTLDIYYAIPSGINCNGVVIPVDPSCLPQTYNFTLVVKKCNCNISNTISCSFNY